MSIFCFCIQVAHGSRRHGVSWESYLTYFLTPCSRVFFEKLTDFQLVKKFPAFYGTRKCPPTVPILSQLHPVHTPTSNLLKTHLNPYPTAFPYGNGMVLHFYQQQESSTTKTVHKVINKGLKAYV